MPSTTNETAVSQCTNRSKALETQHLASRASRRDADSAEHEISRRQPGDRAEDDDGAEPVQRHLVKVIPHPPGGLNEDTRAPVGLVDISPSMRGASRSSVCSFTTLASGSTVGALLSVRGRGDSNEPSDRNRTKDETCSRQ